MSITTQLYLRAGHFEVKSNDPEYDTREAYNHVPDPEQVKLMVKMLGGRIEHFKQDDKSSYLDDWEMRIRIKPKYIDSIIKTIPERVWWRFWWDEDYRE